MSATEEKYCQKSGCTKSYDRDPTLEVQCPSCDADVGELCRRPSGHPVWNQGNNLPKGVHPDRDLKALDEGAYGTCPLGKCPESLSEVQESTQVEQASISEY